NIANDGSVSVVFADVQDMIANPSTAGSNKTITVKTSQEPTSITSSTYPVTSSGTFVIAATVSVDPDTVDRTASYTIQFNAGSNGALLAGDQITVAFPSATTMPGSITSGSIQVNAVGCTSTPEIDGDTVTLYTPVSIAANEAVSVVFLTGIVNPATALAPGYTLNVNTNIEPSPIASNGYLIYNEDGSLPVELAYFSAAGEKGGIALRWRTESETNNFRWILERATEPEGSYEVIADPRGQGSTPQPTDYLFRDCDVKPDQVYFYRLADQDFDGTLTYHEIVSASAVFPKAYRLSQNFPNPFNPATTIEYDLPRAGSVSLRIYNIAGQKVRTLVEEEHEAAFHRIVWDGRGEAGREVGSGVYIYRLVVQKPEGGGDFEAAKRMVMVR
ncbi:MAG: T9SS type A sorting domain-containing protein, partial [Candidatus Latescibacteria bacterium]|nr:T9SS type A sorting domain-containing protein [Candidatus Latescibacterota bacterium]